MSGNGVKTGAGAPVKGSGGCPFLWAVDPPGGDGPAYLRHYRGRFACGRARNSSLLTYRELRVCIEGDVEKCPYTRVSA